MEQKDFTTRFLDREIPCRYVTERDRARDCIEVLRGEDVLLGVDTETAANPEYKYRSDAALNPHLSRIRLLQIYNGKISYVFDLDRIGDNDSFLPLLEEKRFIAHYAMFDLQFFTKMGVKKMNLGCTHLLYKLLFHAVYPTDSGSNAGLADLCHIILKTDILKHAQKSDWSYPDLTFEQIEYAAIDAVSVIEIAKKLAPGLKKYGLENTYQLSKAAQHPLIQLQLNGMLLDVEKHKAKIVDWRDKLYDARREVLKITGLEKLTNDTLGRWLEENLPPEVLNIWPITETEKLSTSAHTFADFSFLPIVGPVSVFKKQEKLNSTYADKLLSLINPATGRLHSHYNLSGARTGRLSCSSPNLQQYPNDVELRSHFIAAPGKLMVCADYSQIEVRVAAEVSRDKEMLRVYSQGLDIYKATAAKLTGRPISEIGKDSRERKIAKALILGLLFGLGAAKFSHYAKKGYGVDIDLEESLENIKAFRELYPEFRAWQLAQAKRCKASLEVRTVGGKLRKLPPDNWYGASLNTPIQGTAAEIILHAMVKVHEDFLGTEVILINCVHDEILVECPESIAKDVATLMEIRMVEAYQELFPHGVIRGLVNIDIGPSWGEAKG